jgi:hypothetical protein
MPRNCAICGADGQLWVCSVCDYDKLCGKCLTNVFKAEGLEGVGARCDGCCKVVCRSCIFINEFKHTYCPECKPAGSYELEMEECSHCEKKMFKLSRACEVCLLRSICDECSDGKVYRPYVRPHEPRCTTCKKLVCLSCLKMCYDCEDGPVYCREHAPEITVPHCPWRHHWWMTCGSHKKKVACGFCKS